MLMRRMRIAMVDQAEERGEKGWEIGLRTKGGGRREKPGEGASRNAKERPSGKEG